MTGKKPMQQISERVKVVVRIRPLNKQEGDHHVKNVFSRITKHEIVLKEKKYQFDGVFKPGSSQFDLYEKVIAPLVADVVEGYNCTAFTYGQTGTGKTYTMTGEKCNLIGNWREDPDAGVIPRVAFHMFEELKKMSHTQIAIKVSYIEIYNEEIRDLLSDNENVLQIYTDHKGTPLIHNICEVLVLNGEEICKLLQKGIVKRQIAPTLMNHQSSRSHTVFTITVNTRENTPMGENILKCGKINLVDLAGNENIARSGCKDVRATELANINKSLLTLGRVINALVDKLQKHIPYRDSKLTRILQDSLGGTTKSVIIATVSSAQNSFEETSSTLEYASRARDIKYTPTINEKKTKPEYISDLLNEIERLQKDLEAARTGSGFYVDKENYQKMLDAIAAVTGVSITSDELKIHKAERIKNLEDLLYLRVKQFDETVEECKRHQDELENARLSLKQKDEILEQEKYLSKWFENQSSEKLEDARRLLSITKTLHDEKEILLSKLEYQFHINKSNEITTREAVLEASNIFDEIKNNETKKIESCEEKVKEEIKKDILNIGELDGHYVEFKNITDNCKSKFVNGKNGYSIKNYVSTRVNNMCSELSENLENCERQITEFKRVMPKITNKNLSKMRETSMSSLKSKNNKIINDIRKKIITKYLENLEYEEATLIKTIKDDEEIINSLKARIEESNAQLRRITQDKEDILEKEKQFLESFSEDFDGFENELKESVEEIENDVINTIDNNLKTQQNEIQNINSAIKEFKKEINKSTLLLDKKIVETIEELGTSNINALQNIEEALKEKINSIVLHLDVKMRNYCLEESFTNFTNAIKKILFEDILEKNLKVNHAGDTPNRCSISYSSQINELTPRESLIQKFKMAMMSQVEEKTSDSSDEDEN